VKKFHFKIVKKNNWQKQQQKVKKFKSEILAASELS